ncbi:MAG: amidohydrolase family protein [Steroidobacteraceae bacterium]
MHLDRRQFLGMAGAAALGSVSGCCSLRPVPSSKIPGTPVIKDFPQILVPKIVANPKKPARYCVDAHTHFFNASDVNVEGYLAGPVADSETDAGLAQLVRALAPIGQAMASSWALPAAEEYAQLQKLQQSSMVPSNNAAGVNPLDQLIQDHRHGLANELADRMKKANVSDLFVRLRQQALSKRRSNVLFDSTLAAPSFDATTIEKALSPQQRLDATRQLFDLNVDAQAAAGDPGGIVEFVGNMLSPRWMNLRTYQRVYSEEARAFGIDGVFGALVDFNLWLAGCCSSSMLDQVKVHSMLSTMSGGYMLPLVGYNPWIDVAYKNSPALHTVQTAIRDYGFVGVKIYPPNGFFPYGNQGSPLYASLINSAGRTRPSAKDLDGALAAFFDWCAAEHVPVMAHAEQSMGATVASDGFVGKAGWSALWSRFAGSSDTPIINLGHFGGGSPPNHYPDDQTPVDFASLMNDRKGGGVFADLAYWTELRDCSEGQPLCKDALGRLKAATAQYAGLGDRIMYGTDWFMISQEQNWGEYPTWLASNLGGVLPLDKLFYGNAIQCFGLGAGGLNRQRLEARFATVPGGLPDWIKSA